MVLKVAFSSAMVFSLFHTIVTFCVYLYYRRVAEDMLKHGTGFPKSPGLAVRATRVSFAKTWILFVTISSFINLGILLAPSWDSITLRDNVMNALIGLGLGLALSLFLLSIVAKSIYLSDVEPKVVRAVGADLEKLGFHVYKGG